jgi:hypothetical protein
VINNVSKAFRMAVAIKILEKSSVFLVFFGVLATPLAAQNTRGAELATSDRELNQAYLSVMRRLSAEGANKLRASQRLWIQFRDAECKLAIADVRDCLIVRTDQRTEQLKSTDYTDRNGNIFSIGAN